MLRRLRQLFMSPSAGRPTPSIVIDRSPQVDRLAIQLHVHLVEVSVAEARIRLTRLPAPHL